MRELNIDEQGELDQEPTPTKVAKKMKQKAKSKSLKN